MALTLDQLQMAALAVGQYKRNVLETISTCEKIMSVVDLRIEVLELSKLELSLSKEIFDARQLTLALTV